MDQSGERPAERPVIGISGIKAAKDADNGRDFFDQTSEKASDQAVADDDNDDDIKRIHANSMVKSLHRSAGRK